MPGRPRAAKPETVADFEHPRYGPVALLADFPDAGPILLSSEGHARWVVDGRPRIFDPSHPIPTRP